MSSGNNNGCHTSVSEAVTSLQLFCGTDQDEILEDAVVGGKNEGEEDGLTL